MCTWELHFCSRDHRSCPFSSCDGAAARWTSAMNCCSGTLVCLQIRGWTIVFKVTSTVLIFFFSYWLLLPLVISVLALWCHLKGEKWEEGSRSMCVECQDAWEFIWRGFGCWELGVAGPLWSPFPPQDTGHGVFPWLSNLEFLPSLWLCLHPHMSWECASLPRGWPGQNPGGLWGCPQCMTAMSCRAHPTHLPWASAAWLPHEEFLFCILLWLNLFPGY